MREPPPRTMYDTAIHFVVEGVSVRVPEELGHRELDTVINAVRSAEARRLNPLQRARAVRVYSGETNRVVAWVDLFD